MRVNPLYRSGGATATEADAPAVEYINLIIEFMKHAFINKPGIIPVFIYEKNGDIQDITVPSSLLNSGSKEELGNLIGAAVNAFKPDSYCFLAEAFIYKLTDNIGTAEEAATAIADFKKGKNPQGISRQECVILNFSKINSDESAERWLGTVPFSRGMDSNISSFGSVQWIKEKEDIKFQGALVV